MGGPRRRIMIARYTREAMGHIWSQESRFEFMRQVEVAVAQVQASMNIIPREAATDIAKKSHSVDIHRIEEIEKVTKHDVIAFVSHLAEKVGPHGRYIHFAMTSSDVLDTALSLQVRAAGEELIKSLQKFENALEQQVKKHAMTLCAGRTHGVHAEPTSFGLKLGGFLAELRRNELRLRSSLKDMEVGKLSGAVGTYSAQSPQVELGVCQKLKLKPETIATQVIPRDRHAQLFHNLAMLGGGLERLAVEFRHLQRTEVSEVSEGFFKGQKGSSAMPHKKNPIGAENITGVARLLRSYSQAAMENIALWHERDISHSSVERVALPDAFILCDYAVDRMAHVVQDLQVNPKRMLENMALSQGQLYSSHILLALVHKGLSREEAYKMVQRVSHSLKEGEGFEARLVEDKELSQYFGADELKKIFSGEVHKKAIAEALRRVGSGDFECPHPL